MEPFLILSVILLVIGVSVTMGFGGQRWLSNRRVRALKEAKQRFHQRREWLEADFLTIASRSGRPRGLSWKDCEFEDTVAFARDKNSGQLTALVGVTISFEAIEGGGMEDVEAVGNLRAASAVFRFEGKEWSTDGRALFNLNPTEAIRHFRHELETVD